MLLVALGAVGLALLLRWQWLGVPLGNDEGGLAYIADSWHGGGPFVYGDHFIDRPPALLLVYRLAGLIGGTEAVRALGLLAALAVAAVAALLARELAGRTAALWAGLLGAALGSSVALGSVLTPSELIAAVPAALSILLVVKAHRGAPNRTRLLLAAGVLAALAPLVKQSFGDALLGGVAGLLVAARLGSGTGRRDLIAYLGGVALPLALVAGWELATHTPGGGTLYAMLGFRLEGIGALAEASGGLGERLERLSLPLLLSGLALVLVWSIAGLVSLRDRPAIAALLGVWGLVGAAGVLAGGSYWSHYLIQLIPFAVVTAAVALSAAPLGLMRATATVLAATILLGGLLIGPDAAAVRQEMNRPAAIGTALAKSARPGDTAHVIYSQANILYYSGLPNPYPYHWSLMLRAIPDAEAKLRALLASPRRPTWIVRWEPSTRWYGLDESGRTARLLRRHYERAGSLCGHPVLLRSGAERRPLASPAPCG